MVKVLLALTSYNETFTVTVKTGVFVVEALHPFEVFRKKGMKSNLLLRQVLLDGMIIVWSQIFEW